MNMRGGLDAVRSTTRMSRPFTTTVSIFPGAEVWRSVPSSVTSVAFRLPAFEGKLRVRERRHPKLYWVDPGLVRAARKSLHPPSREEAGPLLEGWLAVLLRFHCEYDRLFDAMHYWAPADGPLEVGFLLSRGKEFLAVEVKHGEAVHPQHLRGLRAIAPLKGLRRRILVCLGPRRLRLEDGIEVLPVEAFLELLRDGKL